MDQLYRDSHWHFQHRPLEQTTGRFGKWSGLLPQDRRRRFPTPARPRPATLAPEKPRGSATHLGPAGILPKTPTKRTSKALKQPPREPKIIVLHGSRPQENPAPHPRPQQEADRPPPPREESCEEHDTPSPSYSDSDDSFPYYIPDWEVMREMEADEYGGYWQTQSSTSSTDSSDDTPVDDV